MTANEGAVCCVFSGQHRLLERLSQITCLRVDVCFVEQFCDFGMWRQWCWNWNGQANPAERGIRTLEEQVKVLRLDFEKWIGTEFQA